MNKRWLGLLGIALVAPLFAATNTHQLNVKLCHSSRKNVRNLWQKGLFVTTPAVAKTMVDAMGGDSLKVREALAAMPANQLHRWRQSALYLAALEGQTATVESLLDDGAQVGAMTYDPPLKSAFFKRLVGQAKRSPHFGGAKGVDALKQAGVISNESSMVAPAVYAAIECDDVATVDVFLRHHLDPMHRPSRHVSDPFITAIANGDSDITRLFLDHGAKPCVEDHRIAANWKRDKRKTPVHTVASIGAKSGLPAALIKRLTCHAPPPAG